jgi:hypothetical protein
MASPRGSGTRSGTGRWPARFPVTFAALSVVLAAIPRPAIAADPATPTDAERKAIALYQEGVELARQQRWKEAENRFERVVAIRAAPPALFALGRAEIENGKFATAKTTLIRAARTGEAAYAEISQQARDALQALESRIPRLELEVPSDVKGVTVTVDGIWIGAVSMVELDCCVPHDVVVSAPKRRPFATIVTMNEGERRRLRPILVTQEDPTPARAPAPLPPPPPVRAKSSREIVGPLILGGLGLTAGIVGLVVRAVGQSDYDTARDNCSGDPMGCHLQTDVDAGNEARSRVIAGTITASVGLSAVVVAGAWWLLSGTGNGGQATTALGVAVDRGHTMASFRMSF